MKHFLPALAAVSGACSLVVMPAAALELGDVRIDSKLGQPLRASIAYALHPNEQLQAYCVSLNPGVPGGGLPSISRAQISVTDSAIILTGSVPIREPMLGLQLSINCPYTANLQRQYTMFINPDTSSVSALQESGQPDSGPAPSTESAAAASMISSPRPPGRQLATEQAPVAANSRYQVQPGDSLSGIVARISDRPRGLWPAVNAVFAANPHAFIDGDVNLIKAGSWLDIPDLYQAVAVDDPFVATTEPSARTSTAGNLTTAYGGSESPAATADPSFDSGYSADAASDELLSDGAPTVPVDSATESRSLRPGDVIIDSDSPYASAVESGDAGEAASSLQRPAATTVIPDTIISPPVANGTAVVRAASASSTNSWSWLAWSGGAGLGLFLGLLLFGRKLRERFGSTPIGAAAITTPLRRRDDTARRSSVSAEIDFELDDMRENPATMSLDADLELGTGFRGNREMDVAQDFGFSVSDEFASDFDLDLTGAGQDEPEQQPTDVIPPSRNAEPSILESEIPPGEIDEYDLSMIVDATRQPVVDTMLTARDLKAVPVESAVEPDDSEEYTLSREVDYKILEQDYQEEFTTTQALNDEIAKAALELAETMGQKYNTLDETAELNDEVDDRESTELTTELPATSENETSEITAELTAKLVRGEAVNDDLISDLDDTGINEELTAEMPRADNDDNDVTAEMKVEGGRIDTKKSRAS